MRKKVREQKEKEEEEGSGNEEEDEEEEEEVEEKEDEEENDSKEEVVDHRVKLTPEEEYLISNSKVRKFRVPKLNFKAKTYTELFDWNTTPLYEPAILMQLSDDEIKGIIEALLVVPNYPCHTQSVERAIWLITEAATSVIGHDARDRFIRQRMRSRKMIGRFDTKKNILNILDQPK